MKQRPLARPGPIATIAVGAVLALAACLSACVAAPPVLGAPAPLVASSCPLGNLLVSAWIVDSLDTEGHLDRAIDDAVVPEGVAWDPGQGVDFLTAAGSVTYDLGVERPIAAAYVQAEANNGFSLQVSDDGATFHEIWTVPLANQYGRGMRSRSKLFWGARARYIRFGEAKGRGPCGVSELQVFCEIPAAWPPRPSVVPPAEP